MNSVGHDPAPVTVAFTHFESLLGDGLRARIEADPALELVADDVALHDLDAVLSEHEPDALVLNSALLRTSRDVHHVTIGFPKTAVIILTSSVSRTQCVDFLAHGARACLPADSPAQDITKVITVIARNGHLLLHPERGTPSARRLELLSLLTPRETEVHELLRRGYTNPQIARSLYISVDTAHTHVNHILGKLGVHSRRQLVDPVHEPGSTDRSVLRLDCVIRRRAARQQWRRAA